MYYGSQKDRESQRVSKMPFIMFLFECLRVVVAFGLKKIVKANNSSKKLVVL